MGTIEGYINLPAGLTYVDGSIATINKSDLGFDDFYSITANGYLGFAGYGSVAFTGTEAIQVATFQCVVEENAQDVLVVSLYDLVADDINIETKNPIAYDLGIEICKHIDKIYTAEKISNCQTGGWDAYYTCADCQMLFAENGTTIIDAIPTTDINPDNHTHLNDYPAITATCVTLGNNAYTKCEDCSVITVGSDEQFYGDHLYGDLISAVAEKHTPTELIASVEAHYHCSGCSLYFTEEKVETTLEAMTGETPEHSYGGFVSNEDEHWRECACGSKIEIGSHTGGKATCTQKAVCEVCSSEYGELHTHTISGSITSYGVADGEVTVTLYQNGVVCQTVITTNGTYTISGVVCGDYEITIAKTNHVTRTYDVTVFESDFVQNVKIHLIGDINGDGRVNISDVGLVNNHVKKTKFITTDYELLCADVTGDGRINISDVGKINNHVKKTILLW